MGFKIFKKFNYRTFNYLPRYYDEDKERLDAIVGKYDKDRDQTELIKKRISSGFASKKSSNTKDKSKIGARSNIRLLVIIGMLLYITYVLLMSDRFMIFLESLD